MLYVLYRKDEKRAEIVPIVRLPLTASRNNDNALTSEGEADSCRTTAQLAMLAILSVLIATEPT